MKSTIVAGTCRFIWWMAWSGRERARRSAWDAHAVCPERLHLSARVGAFIDFLTAWFGDVPAWNR